MWKRPVSGSGTCGRLGSGVAAQAEWGCGMQVAAHGTGAVRLYGRPVLRTCTEHAFAPDRTGPVCVQSAPPIPAHASRHPASVRFRMARRHSHRRARGRLHTHRPRAGPTAARRRPASWAQTTQGLRLLTPRRCRTLALARTLAGQGRAGQGRAPALCKRAPRLLLLALAAPPPGCVVPGLCTGRTGKKHLARVWVAMALNASFLRLCPCSLLRSLFSPVRTGTQCWPRLGSQHK